MSRRHILVAGADPALASTLKAAARQVGGLAVDFASGSCLADLQEAAVSAVAVVARLDANDDEAVEDFRRLTRSLPSAKIIAAAHEGAGEQVRRLFRAGAADVLTPPFTQDAMVAALAEIVRAHAGGELGRVISVIKAGGGAGATTVAVNMAGLMTRGDARLGRPPQSTAVLDLDLQSGDADIALDVLPRSTMLDVLRAPGRLDTRFLHSVMCDHASGLKLLAAPPALVPLDALGAVGACELVDHVSGMFQRTIIDLPGAWTDWTVRVLARSDLVLLVAPPNVAGAVRAKRLLQALRDAQVKAPVFFLLNKLDGLVETLEKPGRIGRTLETRIDGSVAFDPAAVKACDRGRLAVEAFPNSRLAKDLRGVVSKIEDRLRRLDGAAAVKQMEAVA